MLRLSLITQLTIWCFTLSVITQQGLESSDGRSSNTKTSADKPNVLFIAVDDLRPELVVTGWTIFRRHELMRLPKPAGFSEIIM